MSGLDDESQSSDDDSSDRSSGGTWKRVEPKVQERRQILKPRKGHDQKSRAFLRGALKYELPQIKELQKAIEEKLVESEPVPQLPPLPRLPPSRPPISRSTGQRDFSGDVASTFQNAYDDAAKKCQDFLDGVEKAKTLSFAKLGGEGVEDLRKTLTGQGKAGIEAAENFLAISGPKPIGRGRDTRKPELAKMQDQLDPVLLRTRRAAKAIEDLFADLDPGPDNIGQGLEAKQRGIRFSDLKTTQFGDEMLDRGNSKEDFAGGAVNKVSKLVYGDETRIFKAEALTTNSAANQIGIAGIDKSAPRFGNRNIATSVMSDLLGGSVIPESCYTIHDGKIGLLMQEAPGQEMKDFKKKGFDPTPPSEDTVASLHSQLNDLEWTDMLTGQGDRHDGNYMVDSKGGKIKISGIDNDFCFGKLQGDYNAYGSKEDDRGLRRGPYWGYNSAEMPPLIDKKAYEAIMAKDFDRDVRAKLTGLLTDEEINASATRFAQMKSHAQSLHPDFVVANWKTWRSPGTATPPNEGATAFLKGNKAVTMFQRDFGGLL